MLSPQQELYLDWLTDDRPASNIGLVLDGGLTHEDSPVKGNLTNYLQRTGLQPRYPSMWRKQEAFTAEYRRRVQAELRDPTHMLEVIRHVRAVAKGEMADVENPNAGPRAADELKAAELYARLTGYVAPEPPKETKSAKDMSDEELAAAVAAKQTPVQKITAVDILEGIVA